MIGQELIAGRMQLHHAVQLLYAPARTLLDAVADQSHISMRWLKEPAAWVGGPLPLEGSPAVALYVEELKLALLDPADAPLAEHELDGVTPQGALDWLNGELLQRGLGEAIEPASYVPSGWPEHPLARGAAFDAADVDARRYLIERFQLTHELLEPIVANRVEASPIRTWPEHFDMATLMTVGRTGAGDKTIGIGMSPGDPEYPEPYWYVSPYPYPTTGLLRALDGEGVWHREGWVGAVLTDGRVIDDYRTQVQAFLNSAIDASARLLGC